MYGVKKKKKKLKTLSIVLIFWRFNYKFSESKFSNKALRLYDITFLAVKESINRFFLDTKNEIHK